MTVKSPSLQNRSELHRVPGKIINPEVIRFHGKLQRFFHTVNGQHHIPVGAAVIKDGQIFVAVCGWYGLGRAWIEGLRTDSLYLPEIFGLENLRISQVLAVAIFVLCLGILIYHAVKKTEKPLYIKG
jgi:prolipoprotein diacylglyceryltransferase